MKIFLLSFFFWAFLLPPLPLAAADGRFLEGEAEWLAGLLLDDACEAEWLAGLLFADECEEEGLFLGALPLLCDAEDEEAGLRYAIDSLSSSLSNSSSKSYERLDGRGLLPEGLEPDGLELRLKS